MTYLLFLCCIHSDGDLRSSVLHSHYTFTIGVGTGGGEGGPGGLWPPNILGGGPGPSNKYPATYLIRAYAIQ